MRCHCNEGWLRSQEDGTYLCDACGDVGMRNDESGDVITRQGCVYISAAGCWSYEDAAEPIEHWFSPHNVSHVSALEHFQKHKRWPEDFPAKVYCLKGWQTWLQRQMAAAWMKMVLSYKGRRHGDAKPIGGRVKN